MRFVKNHGFFILFMAIQAIFVVWLIGGVVSVDPATSAEEVGATVGAMLIIALWAAVDIILGFSYVIYKLATRKK